MVVEADTVLTQAGMVLAQAGMVLAQVDMVLEVMVLVLLGMAGPLDMVLPRLVLRVVTARATQRRPATATKVLVALPQVPPMLDTGAAAVVMALDTGVEVEAEVMALAQVVLEEQQIHMARPGQETGTVPAVGTTTTPHACNAASVALISLGPLLVLPVTVVVRQHTPVPREAD